MSKFNLQDAQQRIEALERQQAQASAQANHGSLQFSDSQKHYIDERIEELIERSMANPRR
jgi:hypothetical protein